MFTLLLLATATVALPSPISGDFDHDGKRDIAQFVASPKGTLSLVIRRGATGKSMKVVDWFPRNSDVFLSRASRGRFKTWCGKGGGSDNDPCPRENVNLRGGELMFGAREASESVVLWTGTGFEVVLMSD